MTLTLTIHPAVLIIACLCVAAILLSHQLITRRRAIEEETKDGKIERLSNELSRYKDVL